MAEVPMTELDAVNLMLASIGEAPIDTLNAPGVVEAAIAQTKLTNMSRSIQSQGWWFNRETEYPMAPDVDGNILLPANTMSIDTSARSSRFDVVERGRKLYNRKDHTYTFTETLYCDVVFMLPYEELPQAARWYIAVAAARRFQDAMVGSEALHAFTANDEKMAYAQMLYAESDAEDANINKGSHIHSTVYRHFNPPR